MSAHQQTQQSPSPLLTIPEEVFIDHVVLWLGPRALQQLALSCAAMAAVVRRAGGGHDGGAVAAAGLRLCGGTLHLNLPSTMDKDGVHPGEGSHTHTHTRAAYIPLPPDLHIAPSPDSGQFTAVVRRARLQAPHAASVQLACEQAFGDVSMLAALAAVSHAHVTRLSLDCGERVAAVVVETIGATCPSLTHLLLRGADGASRSGTSQLASGQWSHAVRALPPSLQSLRLIGGHWDPVLNLLTPHNVARLPCLHHLNLSTYVFDCAHLMRLAPQLATLHLVGYTSSDVGALLSACTALSELHLTSLCLHPSNLHATCRAVSHFLAQAGPRVTSFTAALTLGGSSSPHNPTSPTSLHPYAHLRQLDIHHQHVVDMLRGVPAAAVADALPCLRRYVCTCRVQDGRVVAGLLRLLPSQCAIVTNMAVVVDGGYGPALATMAAHAQRLVYVGAWEEEEGGMVEVRVTQRAQAQLRREAEDEAEAEAARGAVAARHVAMGVERGSGDVGTATEGAVGVRQLGGGAVGGGGGSPTPLSPGLNTAAAAVSPSTTSLTAQSTPAETSPQPSRGVADWGVGEVGPACSILQGFRALASQLAGLGLDAFPSPVPTFVLSHAPQLHRLALEDEVANERYMIRLVKAVTKMVVAKQLPLLRRLDLYSCFGDRPGMGGAIAGLQRAVAEGGRGRELRVVVHARHQRQAMAAAVEGAGGDPDGVMFYSL